MLTPMSEAANKWAAASLLSTTYLGLSIAIEPRYVAAIMAGIEDEGLTVGGDV